MRLKARERFQYYGVTYSPEDILDAPDPDAVMLLNHDCVMQWNLEDPKQLSEIPDAVAVAAKKADTPHVKTPASHEPEHSTHTGSVRAIAEKIRDRIHGQ